MIETQTAPPPTTGEDAALDRIVTGLLARFESALTSKINQLAPDVLDRVADNLSLSAESLGMIRLLAAQSNQSKEDVIEKALTLYGLTLDAVEKGHTLAFIDSHDMIVHEVLDICPETAPDPVAVER